MKSTHSLRLFSRADLRFALGALLAVVVVVAFVLCLHTF